MVGEVDELEEDLECSISCLNGVMGVEVSKLEEELADKPGTTIGTKFSVLNCIRIRFLFKNDLDPIDKSDSLSSFPMMNCCGLASLRVYTTGCQNFLHDVRLRHCVFCTGPL